MKARLQTLVFVAVLSLIAFLSSSYAPQASEVDHKLVVTFLDIGQGDGILITTPNRQHILIDGGPDSSVLTQLGAVLPFTERTIDLAIASHNHADHITGLNAVLERYDVQKMWISGAIHTTNSYLEMLQLIKEKQIPAELAWRGKSLDIDGVRLEVLYPLENKEGQRPNDQHDATIVVRLSYGSTDFLLTGDIDDSHEAAMLAAGVPVEAEVLKVPHHGSASGLTPEFLVAVDPEYAVIQVGADNRFGHPTSVVLNRLSAAGVPVFRNDQHGTIQAVSDGQTVHVTAEH